MSTPVVMPQMGESIAEGTIVRWIKKVGDAVDRDEPLFEISTDKVDAEIPSPAAGVVLDISVKEGETVPVNSVVAVIGEAGSVVAPPAEVGRGTSRRLRRPTARRPAGQPPRLRYHPPPHRCDTCGCALRVAVCARRCTHCGIRVLCGCTARVFCGPLRRLRPASAPRHSCAGSPRSTTSTSRRSRDRASAAGSPSTTS